MAIPIGGKHDTFDQDILVSASLRLANSATLHETLPMHSHTVTNASLGLGSLVPYAISGAVYSGTLSSTALALTGVLEIGILLFCLVLQTTSSFVSSDFAMFIPISVMRTPRAKYLGAHNYPNRRRPRCNT